MQVSVAGGEVGFILAPMSSAALAELVARWERLGRPDPEVLCRAQPELLARLRREIRRIRASDVATPDGPTQSAPTIAAPKMGLGLPGDIAAIPIGPRQIGSYKIVGLLGEGGM